MFFLCSHGIDMMFYSVFYDIRVIYMLCFLMYLLMVDSEFSDVQLVYM